MIARHKISTGIAEPKAEAITSANILLGIEMKASSSRRKAASNQPPRAAAHRPSIAPAREAMAVATSATPVV
jgi:hypothetical protein